MERLRIHREESQYTVHKPPQKAVLREIGAPRRAAKVDLSPQFLFHVFHAPIEPFNEFHMPPLLSFYY